jgi:hypothetical protein
MVSDLGPSQQISHASAVRMSLTVKLSKFIMQGFVNEVWPFRNGLVQGTYLKDWMQRVGDAIRAPK